MASDAASIVFGASGCLGSATLAELRKSCPGSVLEACRKPSANQVPFDLEVPTSWILPSEIRYGVIAAAATSREFCEKNPAESRRVNVINTMHLAREIIARGGRVLLFSTNLVFDGSKPDFMPGDQVIPFDRYGSQKVEVENLLLEEIPSALILRLTKVFHYKSPVFEIWRMQARSDNPVCAFNNIFVSPISPQFVAKTAVALLAQGATGIVHLSGNISISYFHLACLSLPMLGFSHATLKPTELATPFYCGSLGVAPRQNVDMIGDSIAAIHSSLSLA